MRRIPQSEWTHEIWIFDGLAQALGLKGHFYGPPKKRKLRKGKKGAGR